MSKQKRNSQISSVLDFMSYEQWHRRKFPDDEIYDVSLEDMLNLSINTEKRPPRGKLKQDLELVTKVAFKIKRIFHLMREIIPAWDDFGTFITALNVELDGKLKNGTNRQSSARIRAAFIRVKNSTGLSPGRYVEIENKLLKEISHFATPRSGSVEFKGKHAYEIHLIGKVDGYHWVQQLAEYARDGELDRFKQCGFCGRWFFARVEHQRCCSLACRQKLHRRNPEYREHHRLYMRNLRRQHKEHYFTSKHTSQVSKSTRGK